jgi:hypothetical protein
MLHTYLNNSFFPPDFNKNNFLNYTRFHGCSTDLKIDIFISILLTSVVYASLQFYLIEQQVLALYIRYLRINEPIHHF